MSHNNIKIFNCKTYLRHCIDTFSCNGEDTGSLHVEFHVVSPGKFDHFLRPLQTEMSIVENNNSKDHSALAVIGLNTPKTSFRKIVFSDTQCPTVVKDLLASYLVSLIVFLI